MDCPHLDFFENFRLKKSFNKVLVPLGAKLGARKMGGTPPQKGEYIISLGPRGRKKTTGDETR